MQDSSKASQEGTDKVLYSSKVSKCSLPSDFQKQGNPQIICDPILFSKRLKAADQRAIAGFE